MVRVWGTIPKTLRELMIHHGISVIARPISAAQTESRCVIMAWKRISTGLGGHVMSKRGGVCKRTRHCFHSSHGRLTNVSMSL